jgi:hypothetical protein
MSCTANRLSAVAIERLHQPFHRAGTVMFRLRGLMDGDFRRQAGRQRQIASRYHPMCLCLFSGVLPAVFCLSPSARHLACLNESRQVNVLAAEKLRKEDYLHLYRDIVLPNISTPQLEIPWCRLLLQMSFDAQDSLRVCIFWAGKDTSGNPHLLSKLRI